MENITTSNVATLPTTSRYALALRGNDLAPAYVDGDYIVVDPTVMDILPGTAVLVDVESLRTPGTFRTCVMLINADGDLYTPAGGFCSHGRYRMHGVITGKADASEVYVP